MIQTSLPAGRALPVLALAACLATAPTRAAEPADPAVELLVSKGRCIEVMLAGKPASCVAKPGVVHVRYRSGRSILMLGLTGKAAVAFVAEPAREPDAREAVLDVSRVRVGRNAVAPPVPVTGSCRLRWSADRTAWEDLACETADEKGRAYTLRFAPAGPLEIERE